MVTGTASSKMNSSTLRRISTGSSGMVVEGMVVEGMVVGSVVMSDLVDVVTGSVTVGAAQSQ